MALIVVLGCFEATAIPITFGFTGTIDHVDDPTHILPGSIGLGVRYSGEYTFDTEGVGFPQEGGGTAYAFSPNPFGMSLTVGGLTISTGPISGFEIRVANDTFTLDQNGDPNEPFDSYAVSAVGVLEAAFAVNNMTIGIGNLDASTLSNEDLLLSPLDLSDWDLVTFGFSGFTGPHGIYHVGGSLDSIFLVPEPATWLLLGTGILAMARIRLRE